MDAFSSLRTEFSLMAGSNRHYWLQSFEPSTIENKVNAVTVTCFPFSKHIMMVNLAKCF